MHHFLFPVRQAHNNIQLLRNCSCYQVYHFVTRLWGKSYFHKSQLKVRIGLMSRDLCEKIH